MSRYHHVDVRQLVAQHVRGFGHRREFVPGQRVHGEARPGGMTDSACRFPCRPHLRSHQASVIEDERYRARIQPGASISVLEEAESHES